MAVPTLETPIEDFVTEFYECRDDIIKMKELLVSGDADPNRFSRGRNALHWAAFYPFSNPEPGDSSKLDALTSVLEYLVAKVDDINQVDEYCGDTALHIACMRSNNVAIPILLSHKKVDINKTNVKGFTPLHRACYNNNEMVVKLLIKGNPKYLEPCFVEDKRMTPLHYACERGHDKIVNIILSSCTDEARKDMLCALDALGNMPLHIACEKNHTEVVDVLLNHQADVFESSKGPNGLPSLLVAAKNGFVNILKLMLRRGSLLAVFYCTDNNGRTILYIACEEGHARVVELLLEYGVADVKKCAKNGFNPLDIAVEKGHKDAALALVNSEKWKDALRNVIDESPDDDSKKCCPCNSKREPVVSVKLEHSKIETSSKRDDKFLTQFTTPMRRIIKRMPDVAKAVFDRCCKTEGSPTDFDYKMTFNFEFLEDFVLKHATEQKSRRNSEDQTNQVQGNEHIMERTPQLAHSSQNHCLNILANSPSAHLLQHPLAMALLDLKWNKYGQILYYSNLIFYFLFLILLTSFALTVPSPNSNLCMEVFGNDNDTFIDCLAEKNLASQGYISFASISLIIYSLIMLIRELVQLIQFKRKYLTSFENYLEVSLFIFTIIFAASVHSNRCYCTQSWQWQVGVIAVFFSWIALIFSIRRLPIFGIYVVMYLAIFYNLVRKVIVLALLLVFAFAFPFYMIFYDAQHRSEGIRTPFNTPWRTIYKTMTMAAGHLNIDLLLHQNNQPNFPDVQYPVAAFSLLILFVVLMPILFLNLLTSLAVGDIVQEIEKKSDTYRLRLRLEFTLPMENFLHSIFTFAEKRKFLSMNLLESWKKKLIIAVDKETVIHPNSNKRNSFIKRMFGYTDHFKTEATNTAEPATKADVKNQIKPLSEEVKELHSSVDQLLSIVKSLRNESQGRLNI